MPCWIAASEFGLLAGRDADVGDFENHSCCSLGAGPASLQAKRFRRQGATRRFVVVRKVGGCPGHHDQALLEHDRAVGVRQHGG